jgi:Leucine-rich repeat (LRR) protein
MKKILLLTLAAVTICVIGCDKKLVDELLNPELSLTPAVVNANAVAGTYDIAVTSNTAWVAVVDNASVNRWCVIESGAKGMEDGTITVALEANTATAVRTATLSVSAGTLTKQVTVTQAIPDATVSISPETIAATAYAGIYSIAVSSNTEWNAVVDEAATWCTLSPASATGNGTITVQTTANSIPAERAATVTVSIGTESRMAVITQAPASIADLRASDSLALVALYNATGGPNWTLQGNWLTAAPLEQWSGIKVRNNRVVYLEKNNTGFSGSLPEELGNLTMLDTLALWNMPNLAGTLPASIGNLTMLEWLVISSMPNLAGTLPASIGNLTNLKSLAIQYTQINGSIPPEIGNLVNLEQLFILGNNFSGVLPDAIGNLVNVQMFSFSEANISGTIPSSFSNLQNVRYLGIIANLTGTIPAWIGELPSLSDLNLSGNQFSGSVPAGLYNAAIPFPIYIYLDYNNLSGTLPNDILAGINAGHVYVCPQRQGYDFSNFPCNDLLISMADLVGEWTVTEDEYYSSAWHPGITYPINIANVSGNEILITGISGDDDTKIYATVVLGYDNYLYISAQDIVPTWNSNDITHFAPVNTYYFAQSIGQSFPTLRINKTSGGLEIEVYGYYQPYSYAVLALYPETRELLGSFMYARNTVWRKAGASPSSANPQKQSGAMPARSLSPPLPQ